MACLLDQQNELQVWDVQGKSKCLTRLKPADILTNEKTTGRFTCIDFTASEILVIGFDSGHIASFDCGYAKVKSQERVCDTAIRALAPLSS
jgi:hypothetical protein